MKTPPPTWPLDQDDHLADALREQGVPEDEIPELTGSIMRLNAWQAPSPAHGDDRLLIAQLIPYLPAASPTRLALRARPHGLLAEFFMLLRLVRTQVSIFQSSFWLASSLIVLLGSLLILSGPFINPTFLLQVIGPLLSYLGTSMVFRGTGLHMLEFELACPPSPRQLTLSRLIIVLSYDVALGLILSVSLWSFSGFSFWLLTLHWLAPLLLVAGLTLLLSLRIPIHQAAVLSYVAWLALLVAAMIGQNGVQRSVSAFSSAVELGFGLAGLAMLALMVIFLPRLIPTLLSKHIK